MASPLVDGTAVSFEHWFTGKVQGWSSIASERHWGQTLTALVDKARATLVDDVATALACGKRDEQAKLLQSAARRWRAGARAKRHRAVLEDAAACRRAALEDAAARRIQHAWFAATLERQAVQLAYEAAIDDATTFIQQAFWRWQHAKAERRREDAAVRIQSAFWTRQNAMLHEAPLPDVWEAVTAGDGRTYYWHVDTQETTWVRPRAPAPSTGAAPSAAQGSACTAAAPAAAAAERGAASASARPVKGRRSEQHANRAELRELRSKRLVARLDTSQHQEPTHAAPSRSSPCPPVKHGALCDARSPVRAMCVLHLSRSRIEAALGRRAPPAERFSKATRWELSMTRGVSGKSSGFRDALGVMLRKRAAMEAEAAAKAREAAAAAAETFAAADAAANAVPSQGGGSKDEVKDEAANGNKAIETTAAAAEIDTASIFRPGGPSVRQRLAWGNADAATPLRVPAVYSHCCSRPAKVWSCEHGPPRTALTLGTSRTALALGTSRAALTLLAPARVPPRCGRGRRRASSGRRAARGGEASGVRASLRRLAAARTVAAFKTAAGRRERSCWRRAAWSWWTCHGRGRPR